MESTRTHPGSVLVMIRSRDRLPYDICGPDSYMIITRYWNSSWDNDTGNGLLEYSANGMIKNSYVTFNLLGHMIIFTLCLQLFTIVFFYIGHLLDLGFIVAWDARGRFRNSISMGMWLRLGINWVFMKSSLVSLRLPTLIL